MLELWTGLSGRRWLVGRDNRFPPEDVLVGGVEEPESVEWPGEFDATEVKVCFRCIGPCCKTNRRQKIALKITRNLTKPDHQWRSSSFQESKKVRVSHDLWSWPWRWAHPGCTLTWSPPCESVVAIRPFACEKKQFAQKFTDRQTDRRRTPRHCISSWNELKT